MTARACVLCPAPLGTLHAQVFGHSPNDRRYAHPDRRNAPAPGGAAPSARGKRQARALHRLRRARLPAGPHGALWTSTRLRQRERLWRRHRTHPAQLQPQRRRQRLGRGHCGRDLRHWVGPALPPPAQTLAL